MHLTPNFFYLFSKRMHNLMKIKKKLCESIKSPRIYGGLKFGFSGSRPRTRRSGTQCCCDVSGGIKFQLSCRWCDKSAVREISGFKTS